MDKKIKNIEELIEKGSFDKETAVLMLGLLKDMAEEIASLSDRCADLEEEIEAINEDVNLLNEGMHIEEYDTVFSAVCPYCQEEIEINIEDLENDNSESKYYYLQSYFFLIFNKSNYSFTEP